MAVDFESGLVTITGNVQSEECLNLAKRVVKRTVMWWGWTYRDLEDRRRKGAAGLQIVHVALQSRISHSFRTFMLWFKWSRQHISSYSQTGLLECWERESNLRTLSTVSKSFRKVVSLSSINYTQNRLSFEEGATLWYFSFKQINQGKDPTVLGFVFFQIVCVIQSRWMGMLLLLSCLLY